MKIIELNEYVRLEDETGSSEDETGSIFMKSMKNVQKKIETDLKKKQKKNPNVKFKELEVGMEVKVRFGDDLNNEKINFSVLPELK